MTSYLTHMLSQITTHRQLIILMMITGFVFGFVYRWVLTCIFTGTTRGKHRNIGSYDRITRIITCIILFVRAISTDLSLILLFASGFCLFESIFSWCGLYAALGKSSCPIQ